MTSPGWNPRLLWTALTQDESRYAASRRQNNIAVIAVIAAPRLAALRNPREASAPLGAAFNVRESRSTHALGMAETKLTDFMPKYSTHRIGQKWLKFRGQEQANLPIGVS